MPSTQVPTVADESVVRQMDLYKRLIDSKTEAENEDRLVVFDLDSEDFEIGDDLFEIVNALRSRRPTANVTGCRIGDGVGRPVDRFRSPRFPSER